MNLRDDECRYLLQDGGHCNKPRERPHAFCHTHRVALQRKKKAQRMGISVKAVIRKPAALADAFVLDAERAAAENRRMNRVRRETIEQRRQTLIRLRAAGASFKEIGQELRMTGEQARQLWRAAVHAIEIRSAQEGQQEDR